MGHSPADIAARSQPSVVLVHFCRLAGRGIATAVGILFGRHKESNGAKRRSGSIRRWSGYSWWRSISWRRSSAPQGPLRDVVVLHRRLHLDISDLCDGKFPPAVLRLWHELPAPLPGCSFTIWSACSSRPGLGIDVLLRADPTQKTDLEPCIVAGRVLSSNFTIRSPASPFSLHPSPCSCIYGAIISTIAIEFVVVTVIVDVLRHDLGIVLGPEREHPTALVLRRHDQLCPHLLQCAFQTTLTFQQLIHSADWVVGHAHLVMFGVFGFWMLGVMTTLFPRLLGKEWYSRRLLEWHFWLSAGGMWGMFLALTFGGIFEGASWMGLEYWQSSINAAMPFWIFRFFTGVAIILGQLCFIWNLFMTLVASPRTEVAARPMFETKAGVFLIAGLGFFAIAFLGNAVVPMVMFRSMPERTVEEMINRPILFQFEDLNQRYPEAFEKYFGEPNKENCAKAFVWATRSTSARRAGTATVNSFAPCRMRIGGGGRSRKPGNIKTVFVKRPVLFGTRRIGPDLSRESGRHSNDWHAAHFFNP